MGMTSPCCFPLWSRLLCIVLLGHSAELGGKQILSLNLETSMEQRLIYIS